jgi:hypothetical protein
LLYFHKHIALSKRSVSSDGYINKIDTYVKNDLKTLYTKIGILMYSVFKSCETYVPILVM